MMSNWGWKETIEVSKCVYMEVCVFGKKKRKRRKEHTKKEKKEKKRKRKEKKKEETKELWSAIVNMCSVEIIGWNP